MRNLHLELEKQRSLLCRLAVQALLRDGPHAPTAAVLAQSRKVDALLSAVERDSAEGKEKEGT